MTDYRDCFYRQETENLSLQRWSIEKKERELRSRVQNVGKYSIPFTSLRYIPSMLLC